MPKQKLTLADELAALDARNREDLLARWSVAYGAPPFKGARNSTLIRGLAYHIQGKRIGALKPSLSRQMLKIAKGSPIKSCDKNTLRRAKLKPRAQLGTQLVREWNSRMHRVHVTDNGFVMSGVTYGSLSAAAKAITGAHWSGPRFFGVAG